MSQNSSSDESLSLQINRIEIDSTLLDYSFKINIINKILNNTELTLNTIQLINFLNYYFGEIESTQEHNDDKLSICFPCVACSLKFSYEPTFHLHLDRRSLHIKLYCLECKQLKIFYNKCKLFYHIYSHKSNIFDPMYKQISIDVLPMDKCIPINSKYTDSFNFIFNSLQGVLRTPEFPKNELDPNNVNLLINKQYKFNEQDMSQIKNFIRRLQINNGLLYRCTVCDALFADPKDLKVHYVQSKKFECTETGRFYYKQLKEKYKNCIIKKQDMEFLNEFDYKRLQFTTKCFQLLNLKLVDKKFKFFARNRRDTLICPECGLVFDHTLSPNYEDYFKLHLKYDCLYTLRYDLEEFKCPLCTNTFATVNDILNHWLRTHLVKEQKCNLCEFKFNDKDTKLDQGLSINIITQMNKHFFDKHKNTPVSITTRYLCECKSVGLHDDKCQGFTNLKLFKSHLIDQINKSILSIECYQCDQLILVKDYVNHVKLEHAQDKFYVCPECGPCKNQEPTFHIHVLRNHLDIKDQVNSTYFKFKNDDVYLCLNCRLFFGSKTRFCHNCWTSTQQSLTNYFSPIYLKFHVGKLASLFKETDVIVLKEEEPTAAKKLQIKRLPNGDYKIE